VRINSLLVMPIICDTQRTREIWMESNKKVQYKLKHCYRGQVHFWATLPAHSLQMRPFATRARLYPSIFFQRGGSTVRVPPPLPFPLSHSHPFTNRLLPLEVGHIPCPALTLEIDPLNPCTGSEGALYAELRRKRMNNSCIFPKKMHLLAVICDA